MAVNKLRAALVNFALEDVRKAYAHGVVLVTGTHSGNIEIRYERGKYIFTKQPSGEVVREGYDGSQAVEYLVTLYRVDH